MRLSTVTIFSLALALAFSAHADVPTNQFHIGVYGGGNIATGDWDLNVTPNAPGGPDTSGIVGFRAGMPVIKWLDLEAGLGVLPTSSTISGNGNTVLSYTGDALFNLRQGRWVPFIDVGAGAYHNVDGDLGSDVDYHVHYGAGVRGMLTDKIALRIDVRHMLTDSEEGSIGAGNVELTAGLDFFPAAESGPDPVFDIDNDGFMDPADACPNQPGHKTAQGCPDEDGDSIVDAEDACPQTSGSPKHAGCPDSDNDNIVDKDDTCPTVAGTAKHAGCPDSDQDGIADKDDACPHQAAPQQADGCPKKAAPPKEITEKFSGAIEGIFFASGSARIRSKSFTVLDDAARVLAKYPEVAVTIEGHTDDQGAAKSNQKLSQNRAEAVRQYFVKKGIGAGRLTAVGFGEIQPIAGNSSKAGRAKNRRIEFKVVNL